MYINLEFFLAYLWSNCIQSFKGTVWLGAHSVSLQVPTQYVGFPSMLIVCAVQSADTKRLVKDVQQVLGINSSSMNLTKQLQVIAWVIFASSLISITLLLRWNSYERFFLDSLNCSSVIGYGIKLRHRHWVLSRFSQSADRCTSLWK